MSARQRSLQGCLSPWYSGRLAECCPRVRQRKRRLSVLCVKSEPERVGILKQSLKAAEMLPFNERHTGASNAVTFRNMVFSVQITAGVAGAAVRFVLADGTARRVRF